MAQVTRPAGVAILVILEAIGGIIAIIGGLAFVVVRRERIHEMPELVVQVPDYSTVIVGVIGAVLIFSGLASFIIARGLWTGKG